MARSEMGFDIAAGSLAIDPIAAEGLPENDNAEESRLCALEARDSTGAEATTVAIAIRAIELWEEGFGK
jgi:hypothetical protein